MELQRAISIGSQRFRCHDPQGHGLQNLADAMRNSCNPYFIALGQTFSGKELLETAKALGFRTETVLTSNMIGSSGTLPTLQQLKLPAEQANFSFGQGVLTATPLQITRMTCAIAGNGTLPAVRLVRGVTENGRTVLREETGLSETGISADTAQFLRRLMCYGGGRRLSGHACPCFHGSENLYSTDRQGGRIRRRILPWLGDGVFSGGLPAVCRDGTGGGRRLWQPDCRTGAPADRGGDHGALNILLGNTAQRLCDRCVREDTKQALKGNLQADGV